MNTSIFFETLNKKYNTVFYNPIPDENGYHVPTIEGLCKIRYAEASFEYLARLVVDYTLSQAKYGDGLRNLHPLGIPVEELPMVVEKESSKKGTVYWISIRGTVSYSCFKKNTKGYFVVDEEKTKEIDTTRIPLEPRPILRVDIKMDHWSGNDLYPIGLTNRDSILELHHSTVESNSALELEILEKTDEKVIVDVKYFKNHKEKNHRIYTATIAPCKTKLSLEYETVKDDWWGIYLAKGVIPHLDIKTPYNTSIHHLIEEEPAYVGRFVWVTFGGHYFFFKSGSKWIPVTDRMYDLSLAFEQEVVDEYYMYLSLK